MKTLVKFCRYLLAATFIFSGFVKGVDPLGTAYKLHDYFLAFGMSWLDPTTTTFAFILCAAELAIGLLLLFGAGMQLGIWGVFLFMLGFTPLTLYLAIANPVSDCGCFGDAILLSNWQTFFKNIVLLLAAIILFANRKNLKSKSTAQWNFGITILLIVISFLPSIHGYRNLPAMDFRPYSIGTNLHDAMATPEGAPADVYKTTLLYQKDGVTKEFDETNYPWQDTTWQFVDSKSVLIKKGYTPPIHDFVLTSKYGVDITDSLINYHGYTFIAVAKRMEKMTDRGAKAMMELHEKATKAGVGFICATASPDAEIQAFIGKYGTIRCVSGDETMLKTIIRANPGIVLLHNGTVIGKWHWRNIPNFDLERKDILAQSIEYQQNKKDGLLVSGLVVALIALLVICKPKKRK